MIVKPKQKVLVCTVALAIGIATGWASPAALCKQSSGEPKRVLSG